MCIKHLAHCLAHVKHSKLLAIDLDTAVVIFMVQNAGKIIQHVVHLWGD